MKIIRGLPAEINQLEQLTSSHNLQTSVSSETAIFLGKEFWIWDQRLHEQLWNATHGQCCFWHIAGLPTKEHLIGKNAEGKEIKETHTHPLFEYEREIIEALLAGRYVWIKKATGLGITTLILAFMAWLCLRDDHFRGHTMGIVVGPKHEMAVDALEKIEKLFYLCEYKPKAVGDSITINGCEIIAYPSHTFDVARGLDKVRFFLIDEADFFPKSQGATVRSVVERYEAKSHPWVVFVSTPNKPGGLYDQIEKEKKSLYAKIFLDYKKGVGTIYSAYEIEQAKKSPSFAREYDLQYGIGQGNIFSPQLVDRITKEYDLEMKGKISVLITDPAYGSSFFGILGLEVRNDGKIYILEAEQRERASPTAMSEIIGRKALKYQIVVCDGSQAGFITDLKLQGIEPETVPFNKELDIMTETAPEAVKQKKVFIHPAFDVLISQMKSIEYNSQGHPDKKKQPFDVGDCLLMGLDYILNKYIGEDADLDSMQ